MKTLTITIKSANGQDGPSTGNKGLAKTMRRKMEQGPTKFFPNRKFCLAAPNYDQGLVTSLDYAEATQRVLRLKAQFKMPPSEDTISHKFQTPQDDLYFEFSQKRLPKKQAALNSALVLDLPRKGDPFFGSDIAVYEDDLPQKIKLPTNGITRCRYHYLVRQFLQIAENKTTIRISSQDPALRSQILQNICILLSRETGRRIISRILKSPIALEISIGQNNKYIFLPESSGFNNLGKISLAKNRFTSCLAKEPSSGGKFLAPYPQFIVLGHELIHHIHQIEGTRQWDMRTDKNIENDKLMTDPSYHNLEEEFTITGIRGIIPDKNYGENQLLDDFGLIPRFGHQFGADFPPGSPRSFDKYDSPVHQAFRAKADLDGIRLIRMGCDISSFDDRGLDQALHIAVSRPVDINVVKAFSNAGADLQKPNGEGQTPLAIARKIPANAPIVALLESLQI